MGRRKRAVTNSMNNLKIAKKSRPMVENTRHETRTKDDDCEEIILWDDVLLEESEDSAEEIEDADDEGDSLYGNIPENEKVGDGTGLSNWWESETVQNQMVVRRKYERVPSQPHQRTLQRKRKEEERHKVHVAGMANIQSMFRRMTELAEGREGTSVEVHVHEDKEQSEMEKMMNGLKELEKKLKTKRYDITGEDRERHEMTRDFMKLKLKDWERPRKDCARAVAQGRGKGPWVARSLLKWVKEWEENRTIKRSKRGRHTKAISWLEDERVGIKVRNWVKEKGEEVTSRTLAAAFGEILKEVEDNAEVERIVEDAFENVRREEDEREAKGFVRKTSIQARTAREWLNKLGYRWKNISKGVFIDGHEREDVVEYRNEFVKKWYDMMPYVREWEEEMEEIDGEMKITGLRKKEKEAVKDGKFENIKEIILVAHDESTFSANDGRRSCWIKEGESVLRPKGRGRGIMVSEFLTGSGRLRVRDEIPDSELSKEGLERDATVYFEYGNKTEGYWKGENLVEQVLSKAIPVFEKEFGKESKACFLFDNSSNHGAFKDDALVADRMNLNSGGKQPLMRDGWFMVNKDEGPVRVPQRMRYEDDNGKINAKGLKWILQERGIWKEGLRLECREKWKDVEGKEHTRKSCKSGITDCCARRLMSNQPDFREQKGMLEEEVIKHGHLVLFLPKFHCECNWIEYFWGDAKRRTREQCDYTWDGLKRTVRRVLESTDERRIWRWYKRSARIIEAYRDGFIYGTEEFKRQYKSHRRIKDRNI